MGEFAVTFEQETTDQLVQQVLDITKSAYVTLHEMREASNPNELYKQEHHQDDVRELEAALGQFAAAHLDEGFAGIKQLPLPENVDAAADAMKRRLMERKLNWAIYDQYEKHIAAEVVQLLSGKTVIATSNKYGHSRGGESGSSFLRQNPTVIGSVTRVDPSLGEIWIGERDESYRVGLWGQNFHIERGSVYTIEQESVIDIIDGPYKDGAPKLGRAAIWAARYSGQEAPSLIQRAAVLEASAPGLKGRARS
ncbi:MAG TPA: hypothetical protein VLF87_02570 [Patescibacteria group bacterium]|nr:hypothetical protein [Patescibacteria group bacterium]